ncbi:MAG: acylneuraminate cytidylyltransferase family protein [Anaerolineae bacterium]|nr:acylneuraminate cytidylyltransferase family protein [Anaerolineae bacterium]
MRALAVIPARGGSKGLPRKNVLQLGKHPLIAHTILAALGTPQLTDLIVSTDDEEIAWVAHRYNAAVPFMRPPELATDTASAIDVALHALDFMEESTDQPYDAFLLLQPTCPLRRSEDIQAAIRLYQREQADSVISIYKLESTHPYYMYLLDGSTPRLLMPEAARQHHRQDYPPVYVRNGAIYLVDRDVLHERRSFYGDRLRAVVMPEERSVNVDTRADLVRAEALLKTGDQG